MASGTTGAAGSLQSSVQNKTAGSGARLKVKVFKINSAGKQSPHVTINPLADSEEAFLELELSDLRKDHLVHHVKFDYTFCLADLSGVPEDMKVGEYLDAVDPEDSARGNEVSDDGEEESTEENSEEGQQEDSKSVVKPGRAKSKKPKSKKPAKKNTSKPMKPKPDFHQVFLRDIPPPPIEPPVPPEKSKPEEALDRPFILKFVLKGDAESVEGSVESSTLPKPAASLSLGRLRRMIQTMQVLCLFANHTSYLFHRSVHPNKHEFCFNDQTPVSDAMTLKTYMSKGDLPADFDSDTPTLCVYFRKVGTKSNWSAASDALKAKTDVDIAVDPSFSAANGDGNISIDKMKGKVADFSKMGLQQDDLNDLKAATVAAYLHAGELDEMQWQTVVRNCNLMYGWYFDLATKSIKRASHPAFRLRDGLNIPGSSSRDDTSSGAQIEEIDKNDSDSVVKQHPGLTATQQRAAYSLRGTLNTPKGLLEAPTQPQKNVAKQSNETVSAASGKDVANEPNSKAAASDAGNTAVQTQAVTAETSNPLAKSGTTATTNSTTATPPTVLVTVVQNIPGTAVSPAEAASDDNDDSSTTLPPKPNAMPSFTVNDESRVEITLVSSELQESMAKNNFTATSFEAGGSGTFKGVEVGVKTAVGKQDELGVGKLETKSEKLMVANYKFPRASVYLGPEDLEPTEDLRDAIELVRTTKNVTHLRDLHRKFGHLFCQEVVIGGRLQTTKSIIASDVLTESLEKSKFKASVGVAVSVPMAASISTKYSKETGTAEEIAAHKSKLEQSVIFEATGGNTILAADPPAWSSSVSDYKTWRVIERAELSPLGKMIAECASKDLQDVREWFVQAVPGLSKFISVPASRILDVRLKLLSEVPGLTSVQKLGKKANVCNYLGHQFGKPVHPIRVGLTVRKERKTELPSTTTRGPLVFTNLTTTLKEVDWHKEVALFTPAQARAPVILQYEDLDNKKGLTPDRHKETVWEMVVPYGEYLFHGSLVMLKSSHATKDLYLTIYRNGQGHYMPGITTSGDPSFWRILKHSSLNGSEGGLIKEGDAVRLCWRFSDQSAGFRDFHDDFFGRRRFTKPDDAEDHLYLKIPFPGFQRVTEGKEKESDGVAMMMSAVESKKQFLQAVSVVPAEEALAVDKDLAAENVTYNLFDTTFRIDIVGNEGKGEQDDYLTYDLDQAGLSIKEKEISSKSWDRPEIDKEKSLEELQTGIDTVGTAIMGPLFPIAKREAKAVALSAWGLVKGVFDRF
ncbi:hypothetical protein MMC18_001362 [Xylographa bjoerkii]|nr:hypothetical protein [Xylographa bjoerkii]